MSALCSLATGKVKMFKYSLDVAINRTQYGQDGLISEMLSTRRLNMSVPVCYLRPVIRTSPPANLAYFLLDVIGRAADSHSIVFGQSDPQIFIIIIYVSLIQIL